MITYATISSVEQRHARTDGQPYLRIGFEEEPGALLLFRTTDEDLAYWRGLVGQSMPIRISKVLGTHGQIYRRIVPFRGFRGDTQCQA